MYLYVELWKPRPEWLSLSKKRRLELFSQITLQWLNDRGVNLVSIADENPDPSRDYATLLGSAINQSNSIHTAEFRWFAAWSLPDERVVGLIEERVEQLGWWYDYFDQVNAWGKLMELKDQPVLVNDMTQENESLTRQWLGNTSEKKEEADMPNAKVDTTLSGKIAGNTDAINLMAKKIDCLIDLIGSQMRRTQDPRGSGFADISAKQSERPTELDQLTPLVGRWSGQTVAKNVATGEEMTGPGTRNIMWGVGDRFLVGHSSFDMGKGGHMETIELFSWDATIKKFRTWWFHNWGMFGEGTAEIDPKTKSMMEQDQRYNLIDGSKNRSTMVTQTLDDNTVKWVRSEYDEQGNLLFTLSDTNRRITDAPVN